MPGPLRRGTLRPIRTSKRCASGLGTVTWVPASSSPSFRSSASPMVAEPVAIIPDQLAVAGAGLVEFGQRHVERTLTVPRLAEQPLFLVQVILSGFGKPM